MKKQNVLVVDDEPRNIRIITETLEDLVEIKSTTSGEEALAAVQDFIPDLVLLDIMMPGIDGYEVCRRFRSDPKLSLTKIILISGKAMTEERLKGYEIGADDYMTKPYVPEELLAKVKVFLRLVSMERSLEEQVDAKTRELYAAEAKMVHAAKMSALGEMAGGIAHEVNTPLGTIGLVANQIEEVIQVDPVDKVSILKMAATISSTVQRISKIVYGLRTFSRSSENDKFETVPVKKMVDDLLALCRERVHQGSIGLEVTGLSDDMVVYGQPVQISQVLLNLVSNACDAVATLPEKWIKIGFVPGPKGLEITVTDSGPGIAEEAAKKIFDPFFTTKEIGKGTGLGLSISKGIVDSHGGELYLDRTSPNTCFKLVLPTTQKTPK